MVEDRPDNNWRVTACGRGSVVECQMILRPNGSSQLLITQPDHAALAARVMRQWRADGLLQSPRLPSILLAVEEHDNGWREVDTAPLVDASTGRVLDFIGAPEEIRRPVWPRGVDRLADTPYAAALVAQHALHIYRRYRDNPGGRRSLPRWRRAATANWSA